MLVIVSCQWIWLIFKTILKFSINSTLIMQTGRTFQGTYFDAVGLYFLQISECRIYEILCYYLTVASNIFIREFPTNVHSIVFHYPLCRAKSHIYRQCYVTNAVKYGSFVADILSPCLSWLLTATELLYLACHHQTVRTTTHWVCSDYSKCWRRSECRRIIVCPIFW